MRFCCYSFKHTCFGSNPSLTSNKLCSWVMFDDGLAQVTLVEMSVYFGGYDRLMTQHLLHCP